MHTADDKLTVRVPITAGAHRIGVSFVDQHWESEGVLQPPQRGFARTTNELYFGNPSVDHVTIAGRTRHARRRFGQPAQGIPVSPAQRRRGRRMRAHDSFNTRPPRVPAADH
jgi:hypothetical protein